jgi:alkanesulfonate monooxygenase SsuD/methylene tetrahydromethanopterin reductase-like flavin-dependent oxidoreductase (luciferase family)
VDHLAERIPYVRSAARSAGREDGSEIDVLVQRVIVTDDRPRAVAELAAATGTAVEDHIDTPFLLIGTETEVAGQLQRMQELGVYAVTVFESSAEPLAPVITRLRR